MFRELKMNVSVGNNIEDLGIGLAVENNLIQF